MRFYDLPEMKRRLTQLDAERESLVRLIAAAEAYEGRLKGEVPPGATSVPQMRRDSVTPSGTVLRMTEDAALGIIEATGLPVQTREVIEVMRKRGLPLPNKNVTNVVSARLSNSSRLEGRRGLGWWPKGRPWPDEQPPLNIYDGRTNSHNENGEADASPDTGEVQASPDASKTGGNLLASPPKNSGPTRHG